MIIKKKMEGGGSVRGGGRIGGGRGGQGGCDRRIEVFVKKNQKKESGGGVFGLGGVRVGGSGWM